MHVYMYAYNLGKSFIIIFFLKIQERGLSCTDWCVMTHSTS